jgi:putative endonuclease
MIRSAQYYLYHNHMENIPCRFDVIAILGKEISHIQNAFEVS